MKKLVLSATVILITIATSCSNDSHSETSLSIPHSSFELNAHGDTINILDGLGKKQGKWITKNNKGSMDTIYYKDGIAQ